MIEYLGNTDLLKQPMTAFLAPSKIEPLSVLPTLDWATEMAQAGRVIVSGFSSRLETDVWDVLVRNGSPIVSVMVPGKYKQPPPKYRPLLDNGQLLLIFLGIGKRLDRQTAPRRNAYVANLANEVVFPSINPTSSLYPLFKDLILNHKTIIVLNQETKSL